MAADWGGSRAAAAAAGIVGGKVTPTGLRDVPRGMPRSRAALSDIRDSAEGDRGWMPNSPDSRESHLEFTFLEPKKKY